MTPGAASSPAHSPEAPRPPGCLANRDANLERLKALAGRLAHDFNNALVPILGYLMLIKEELPPEASSLQFVQAMENSTRITERNIENILLSTRPQRRFQPKNFDLAALVDQELESWLALIPDSACITVNRILLPCPIQADPSHWQNVVLQVLRNARFALALGGSLSVSLLEQQLTPAQVLHLGLCAPEVFVLEFKDTGIGMSAHTLQHAMEPFFSTRPKNVALGLGLTIVHSVAHFHGGQVLLESVEQAGTTLRIYIPVQSAASKGAGGSSLPGAARRNNVTGRKLLLVEPDPLALELLKTSLTLWQFEVVSAGDLPDAIKLFTKHASDLVAVLANSALPSGSGLDLARRVTEQQPHLPVLLMNGEAEAGETAHLSQTKSQGAACVILKKPISLPDLSRHLQEALNH